MNKLRYSGAIVIILMISSLVLGMASAFAQDQSQGSVTDQNEEVRGEFGNWLQVCAKGTDQCVAVQFALDVQGEQAARFVLERLTNNTENPADSVITFFIPFESSIPVLPAGLSFTVDANESFLEQFLYCDPAGCTSQFGITNQGVDLFKQGANLTIQVTDVRNPNSTYIVDLDLDQFTSIYESLKEEDSG